MTQSKKARALGFNHIALEVGDVDEALAATSGLDFYDPWGNRVEIVGYEGIQFSKAPNVLRGMGMAPD
jgi:hypothetical protein